ncbi:protein containing DUF132 [Candidatus Magnetomorum sp. HK-1]|nr:protein containing DUF132 [Candidatus Magnetomorum sp. HK-1]
MKLKIVIDTNVLFEGLTNKNSPSSQVIDALIFNKCKAYICNALAYEYEDVLSRKLSKRRWSDLKPIFTDILLKMHFTDIVISYRPSSPDPGDDHVIDCAVNSNSMIVTNNTKDFKLAKRALGIKILKPENFITLIGMYV